MANTTSMTQRAISTNILGRITDVAKPSTAPLLSLIRTIIHGNMMGILKTGINKAPLFVLEAKAERSVNAAPILMLPKTNAIKKNPL